MRRGRLDAPVEGPCPRLGLLAEAVGGRRRGLAVELAEAVGGRRRWLLNDRSHLRGGIAQLLHVPDVDKHMPGLAAGKTETGWLAVPDKRKLLDVSPPRVGTGGGKAPKKKRPRGQLAFVEHEGVSRLAQFGMALVQEAGGADSDDDEFL